MLGFHLNHLKKVLIYHFSFKHCIISDAPTKVKKKKKSTEMFKVKA